MSVLDIKATYSRNISQTSGTHPINKNYVVSAIHLVVPSDVAFCNALTFYSFFISSRGRS